VADSVEQVIYNYLAADSGFMGNFTGVYFSEAPENATYPYIVFWLVTDAGIRNYVSTPNQGEARIQFDIWDDEKFRGVRLRDVVRAKVDRLNETRDGYSVSTVGINEQTIQRTSGTDPYHFVVDGIIQWQE